MTPDRECVTCGHPALRPDGHAPWCARIAAWLRPQVRIPRTPAQRANHSAYMRAYRARKKAAAA